MSPSPVVFDTNVIIRYGQERLAREYVLSSVVLQELTAGAADDSALRRYERTRRAYEADGRLLVPTGEDWYAAGKVLNLMWRGRRSRREGLVPAIPKEEQQRLLRDVLIARSAKRIGALVVTEDLSDFEKIRRYCDVRVEHPSRFF